MVYTKKLGWPVLFRRQSKNPSVPSNVAFTISEDSESFDYSLVLDGDRTSYGKTLIFVKLEIILPVSRRPMFGKVDEDIFFDGDR
jgi:hypothetical protein